MFGLTHKRRQRLSTRPFPPAWADIIEQNAAFYGRLPPEDQRELRGHIQVFLAEKRFEGCGGLAITDEIRITIAAYACRLLLHRETNYYPLLITVLVYPHPFRVSQYQAGPAGQALETDHMLSGESWRHGNVVLAWDEVLNDALGPHDGHNVVLHEFAHQLDEEDGSANGAPILPLRSMIGPWASVLGADYAELVRETEAGQASTLDQYGATDPAEFFAVATESFFETPVALRTQHPQLYEELRLYYQQDPADHDQTPH